MADRYTNQLEDKAAWATTFGASAPNAGVRKRYAEDITAAQDNRADIAQDQFDYRMSNDPKFAQTMNARERLVLDRESRFRDDALAERRFNFDMEKTSRAEALAREKFDLDILKEDRALRRDEIGIKRARRVLDQTSAFEDAMEAAGDPGTPGFAKAYAEARRKNPWVDPKVAESYFEAANIEGDPHQFAKDVAAMDKDMEISSVTRTPNGKMAFTARRKGGEKPEDAEKAYADTLKEWHEAVKLRAGMADKLKDGKEVVKPGFSNEDLVLADELKTRAAAKLNSLRKPTQAAPEAGGDGTGFDYRATSHAPADASSAAPTKVIINKQTGQRMGLINGAWQPL